MTKRSTHSPPEVPPADVPLDQTIGLVDWEGREPPSPERWERWDFRLIEFLANGLRRKPRGSG